jgi:hypothetical protein
MIIKQTCSEYDISVRQIYEVTVDNEANMLNVVRILKKKVNEFNNNKKNINEITGF